MMSHFVFFQEFCETLKTDIKQFRNYLKVSVIDDTFSDWMVD